MSEIIRINDTNYRLTPVSRGCRGCSFNGPEVTDGCNFCTVDTILTEVLDHDEQTDDGGLLPPQGALE